MHPQILLLALKWRKNVPRWMDLLGVVDPMEAWTAASTTGASHLTALPRPRIEKKGQRRTWPYPRIKAPVVKYRIGP
jgi:hypothetical protein